MVKAVLATQICEERYQVLSRVVAGVSERGGGFEGFNNNRNNDIKHRARVLFTVLIEVEPRVGDCGVI